MPQINLLPWRLEKRAQVQKNFNTSTIAAIALSAGAGYLINQYFDHQLNTQIERNTYLTEQTRNLRLALQEIDELDKTRDQLQTRINLVYTLSGERIKPIKLIDEIARRLPSGVYLKEVDNSGDEMLVIGETNSHILVSNFVAELEKSPWIISTRINEVTSEGNNRNNEDRPKGAVVPSSFSVTVFTEFPASYAAENSASPEALAATVQTNFGPALTDVYADDYPLSEEDIAYLQNNASSEQLQALSQITQSTDASEADFKSTDSFDNQTSISGNIQFGGSSATNQATGTSQ